MNGKKKKLTKAHFEQFGKSLDLTSKQISGVFNRLQKNKPKAFSLLEKSFLPNNLRDAYKLLLEERFERLK